MTNGYVALNRVFAVGNRTTNLDRLLRGEGQDPNWFCCADGTVLSVIAGGGTYCSPKGDSGPYSAVEVWWPGQPEPTGYVPVDEVRAYVEEHGGIVAVGATEAEARTVASDLGAA
jgi:hypothetical protein